METSSNNAHTSCFKNMMKYTMLQNKVVIRFRITVYKLFQFCTKDLAMNTANENGCSIILANDPDSDRMALAEKQPT